MNSEHIHPISPEEARSALEEIDQIGSRTRRAIAAGIIAPMFILWGAIWIIGFSAEQYLPHADRLWLVLDLVGIACSILFGAWSRRAPVKGPGQWRIGISWLILFAFAGFWCFLLVPVEMSHGSAWQAYGPALERKMAVLWATVCMFAYMIMGLWLDRVLLYLGAIVTVAVVLGFIFLPNYLYLWIAATGGGSLVVSGLFIRKCWR